MFDKRLNIIVGHFGSGKTEIAVNMAFALKAMEKKVAIVDIDIVNPFFRTADVKDKFEKAGIRAILPVYANTNVDVPALSGEINVIFEQKSYDCIIDVGGDDLGARALSRYSEQIKAEDYNLYMIINTLRPYTETPEKIIEMLNDIQNTSQLKVTGFVNNTNLLSETDVLQIVEGHRIIEEASKLTNIPISFVSCMENLVADVREALGTEVLSLNKNILLPWQQED